MISKGIPVLLCAASSMALSAHAAAQDAPGAESDHDSQIIVTAQKRSEDIVDVPISVSVVTAEQLERQQITTIQDLERASPQVAFTEGGEGNPGGGAVVRGIGTQAFSRSASGSVGIVVDGVPTGNVNITNLFDLARVEVLAGPQGTLFGDSVSAGLINVVTNRPDFNEISGRIAVEYSPRLEDVGEVVLRGVTNLPLANNAALRVSGYYRDFEGPGRNTFRNVKQGNEEYGVRGRLLIEPTDTLSIDLIGDYNHTRSDEFFNAYVNARPGSPLPAQLAACGVTIGPDNSDKCGSDPSIAIVRNWGVSAQINLDIGDHTLTSITGYRDQGSYVTVDVDGLPSGTSRLQIFSGPETHPADFFTQELRLTSPQGGFFEYVVGAFYSIYDSLHSQRSQVTIRPNITTPPVITPPASLQITDTMKRDRALFGQATLNFTEDFRGIVGARLNRSTMDDIYTRGTSVPLSAEFTNFSFKLGLAYDFDEDANIYATVTRGYKGPQANNIDPAVPPRVVNPEVPMYYEVGAKAGLFNGELIASAALFYGQVKGYQAQYCAPVSQTDPTPLCAPNNVDGVVTKGFDLLLIGEPVDGLSLSGGLSYAHATYPDGFLAPDGTQLGGRQLANAPRWRATMSSEYSAEVSNDAEGFVSLSVEYQSPRGLNLTADPLQVVPSRVVLGGRLGVRIDDRMTFALFARNLNNASAPNLAGAGVAFAGEPGNVWRRYNPNSFRIIGLSADMSF